MKTATANMQAHLLEEVTTLARCWSLVRTDGVGFYFTEHDVDIVVDGNTYLASTGFSGTAIANNAGMNVDNMEVMGFFDSETIKNEELRAGLFDYAEIKIFFVNWADIEGCGKIKMRRGQIGEVLYNPQGFFKTEIRGLAQRLQQRFGELYAPECRADLGDTRCKVPLDPSLRANSTQYNVGDYVKVSTGSGSGYELWGGVIFKCVQAGQSDAVQPVFDYTVGNQTTEGGAFATNVFTLTALPANLSTVTVGGKTYQFRTTYLNLDGVVVIGATPEQTLERLEQCINDSGVGEGVDYAAATLANVNVTATHGISDQFLTVTAIDMGSAANEISCTDTVAGGSWATATMTGGKDELIWEAVSAFTKVANVTGVTDRGTFTSDLTGVADGYMNGGLLAFETGDNVGRPLEVKSQVGGAFSMYLPFGYLPAVGDRFTVYPGCDKRRATCQAKFANVINFRGEPDLPGRDAVMAYPDANG